MMLTMMIPLLVKQYITVFPVNNTRAVTTVTGRLLELSASILYSIPHRVRFEKFVVPGSDSEVED